MSLRKSKMGRGGSKEMSQVTSWEKWCVNFSFFFITGAQAILWPWCPVILKAAGLGAFGSGIALSLITISSIFGLRISLWAVNKTRNGAVRRLLILGMFSCSIFFSISSVLILPSADNDYFCSTKPMMGSKSDQEIIITTHSNEPINTKSANYNKDHFSNVVSGDTVAASFPSAILNETSQQTVFIRKINLTQTYSNVNDPTMGDSHINTKGSYNLATRPALYTNFDDVTAAKVGYTSPPVAYKQATAFYTNNSTLVHAIRTQFPSFFKNSNPTPPIEVNRNGSSFTQGLSDTASLSRSSWPPNLYNSNSPPYKVSYTKLLSPPSLPIVDSTVPKVSRKSHNGPSWSTNYDHLNVESISKTPKVPSSDFNIWKEYDSPIVKKNTDNEIWNLPQIKKESQLIILKREIKNRHPLLFDYHPKGGEVKNKASNLDGKETTPVTSFGVGVAVILIIAMLMGGGVDSVISKIWFCRKNGLCQDTERIDEMDITISPIFQICVMGDHRYWSLISSSLWITLPTIFVGLLCQMGADIHNPLTVMGVFHGLAGLMSCFTLLFIPMPYGSLRRCRTRRPLSLYLDDEVIREGLRRVSFHLWVYANGLLGALPTFFTLWLLQESSATKGEIFVSQVISITALLFGEAVIAPTSSWLSRKLNAQGVMIMSSSFLWIQCLLAYYLPSPWIRSGSLLLVGYSVTTMWTAIRNNAFLLGTARDQEQEAWASWISWKVGAAFGATIWASLLEMEQVKSVQSLLLPAAVIGMIITTALLCIALLTKSKESSRRRIYHTLDLHNYSEDDDDEIASPDNEKEDDWLVKRAKKEGLTL